MSRCLAGMLLWLIAFQASGLVLVQADFDVVFEDVECSDINEEYVKSCEMELNYDSTYGSSMDSRLEVVKQFPDDVKIQADMFTVRMGEYNVDVGLHVNTLLCDFIGSPNSIGILLFRAISMGDDNCPPEPGVYEREGYVLDDTESLPSSFPGGHYLITMKLLNEESLILRLDIYFKIY